MHKNGERIIVGGYIIGRENNSVYTDRTNVIHNHTELQNHHNTPSVKNGNDVEVYVDTNIIEVYVNDGEYVLTNAVYDLIEEIKNFTSSAIHLYGLNNK